MSYCPRCSSDGYEHDLDCGHQVCEDCASQREIQAGVCRDCWQTFFGEPYEEPAARAAKGTE
jgi:hypothetical protein